MFKQFSRIFACLIITMCVFTLSVVYAQNTSQWTLIVLSKQGKNPISKATVQIEQQTIATQSNGVLNLELPFRKSMHIIVSSIGYESNQKHIILKNKFQTDTIFLTAETFKLKEVNVSEIFQKKPALATSNQLTENDLDKTAGDNLGQQLSKIQGVSVLQTGANIAKPVINGMHSNRVLILNNGVRQEGQQWGNEHAPEIDPFIAKNITVIKGAESVRYGSDAIGGVVLVEPPKLPVNDIIHGDITAVGESNGRKQAYSASIQGNMPRNEKWGWRAQGTYIKSGDLKTSTYYLTNTGVKELNFSGAVGYTGKIFNASIYASHFGSELGILKASSIGNQEDLLARIRLGKPAINYPFSDEIEAPRQKISHDLMKIKSNIQLESGTELIFQYDFQHNHRQEFDIRRGGRASIPSLDLNLYTQDLSTSWKKSYHEMWKTEIGLQASNQVNNNTPGTFVTPLIPNYDSYGGGLFAIQKYAKNNALYEAGIRYDYKYLNAAGFNKKGNTYGGTYQFHNISWNLAAEYHLTHSLHFNSNLGMAWRPPQVNELFSTGLHQGTATLEIGDDKLRSENAIKWINTLNLHGEKIEFEASIFAQYIKNYIYLNPTNKLDTSIRGVYPVFEYKQNDALFWGTDLWANFRFSKNFSYEAKVAIVQAENLNLKNYFPWIPSNHYTQTLSYNLSNWNKLRDNYFEISYQYTAKQNRFTPQSDFAPPPTAYSLWNIQMGTKIPFGSHNLACNITVSNLFNETYKDYLNRFRYFANDLGRNIQLRIIYKF